MPSLPPEDLLEAARSALRQAYAPYSGFRVGAAIRTASGGIFAGCNVENASYPVSLCAERGAIAAAILAGEREITEVLIVSDSPDPCPPCGMCRQALWEFGPDLLVHLVGRDGDSRTLSLRTLLPEAFGPSSLDGFPGGRS